MGNLYGSEYWTYLLPRRTGRKRARKIVERRLPLGTLEAYQSGLIDQYLAGDVTSFDNKLRGSVEIFANAPSFASQLEDKTERLRTDEKMKPLQTYREDELAHMKLNFYGFDPSYHVARYNFVYKIPKSRTPVSIAHHRDKRRGNVNVMNQAS
jgi:putative two-component system hydrogenase maturation factor HypX/HoxX